jgi:3-isopropylmalate dehydratase small subunit
MVLEGLDVIGLTLTHPREIEAFAARHWARQPWLRDVAAGARERVRGAFSLNSSVACP